MTSYYITNNTNLIINTEHNHDIIHFLEYGPYEFQVCVKQINIFPKHNQYYFNVNNYYYNSEIFIRIYFGQDLQDYFDKEEYNLELFGDRFYESSIIHDIIKLI
jgi:hypothetical protein